METFLQQFGSKIKGVLTGFDLLGKRLSTRICRNVRLLRDHGLLAKARIQRR